MFSELCSEQVCLGIKLRLASLLLIVVLVWPYLKYLDYSEGQAKMSQFSQQVRATAQQTQGEAAFSSFLHVLSRSTFSGVWQSSIKESKLLKQQNGTIELKTSKKTSENEQNSYKIIIKIYDGPYRDDGNSQIEINSSSFKIEQQFGVDQVIYETASPLIGLYRSQKILHSQKTKPIFVNKIKFRLNVKQNMKIQLLLAAEYDINIITESLEQNWQMFEQIVFTLIILAQICLQIYGSYSLLMETWDQDLIAYSISPTFLKLGICYDTAQLLVLCYLVYWEGMVLLVVPAYFMFIHIFYLEIYMLGEITRPAKPKSIRQGFQQHERETFETVQQSSQSLVQTEKKLKSLTKTLEHNQDYIMWIGAYVIFYLNNMQDYIYIVFFFIMLLPQITRNCRIANKINYEIENIFTSAYPRLIPILYMRLLGNLSRFYFEPHYWTCLVCVVFVVGSTAVLFLQQKHGSRSILPKFLIPKGLKTKFKFFAIQDENLNCIVCRSELAQLTPQLKQKNTKQQVIYNKVVLTPCHHKFHAYCLEKWMENRTQCPSCPHLLPPVDSY